MSQLQALKTLGFLWHHPLASRQRARAIAAWVRWQCMARLRPGPVLFPWIDGAKLLVHRGEVGLTGNVYTGLHEFESMAYLLHVLRPEDLFIDVGANVGSYTVLAAAARHARAYCFEPVPSTFARLLANLEVNDIAALATAQNIGLADKDGELRFTSSEGSMNHVLASGEDNPDAIPVPVRTLDSLLQNESPALLKIDTEGFETPVINGALQTLAKPSLHSILVEMQGEGRRYGFDESALLQHLIHSGFEPYTYDPFTRQLQPLHNQPSPNGNTLFLRNLPHIRSRLHSAPKVRIGSVSF